MNAIIVSNRVAIAHVDPKAQNAVNSVYMVHTFCGQLFGTAVGNALYAKGGWTYSGAFNIAQLIAGLSVLMIRGPHEKHWVGWRGGWNLKKSKEEKVQPSTAEADVEANVDRIGPEAVVEVPAQIQKEDEPSREKVAYDGEKGGGLENDP